MNNNQNPRRRPDGNYSYQYSQQRPAGQTPPARHHRGKKKKKANVFTVLITIFIFAVIFTGLIFAAIWFSGVRYIKVQVSDDLYVKFLGNVDEDGNRGLVAERRYYLKLETMVSVEEAEALVVECMLMQQKIYNAEGNYSTESSARYLYEYQYVMSIEGQGDFYVIAEIFMDDKGVKSKTGSYYAVSVNEKRCFKLTIDGNNNYSIVEILIDSPQEG